MKAIEITAPGAPDVLRLGQRPAPVAAAGEVNVNAIAPGISAALAATVAGLFVAIPALFGYNYLLTRVKECSVEMHMFVESFITRMAENYNNPAALHAIADE